MTLVAGLARWSRPLRRHLTPGQFKETHINDALRGRISPCYVEIGVRQGESLRRVTAARKIGVDPDRVAAMDQLHAGEEFFHMTSDDFFAHHADRVLTGRTVDVALIDGLHEFEQALRDFLNLERYMRVDGVIFVDDCNPRTRARAEVRDGGAWNGDVWRAAALIAATRTDLRFVTIDCDQGLGKATGFGEAEPRPPSPASIERFRALGYDVLALDRQAVINLSPKPPRRAFRS